jgi:hypothetical protein
MKKKISLIILGVIIFQVLGYYSFGKMMLVNKLLNERERIAGLEDAVIININSNFEFTGNHKEIISRLFEGNPLSYYQYQDIDQLPENRIFPENMLCYTFDVSSFSFPLAEVTQIETIKEFGAHDSIRYAWILFFWIELKYLRGGIS